MASADSSAEALEARRAGWKTFRTRAAGEPLLSGEGVCPASDEAGKGRSCDTCYGCDGKGGEGFQGFAIIAHGARRASSPAVLKGAA